LVYSENQSALFVLAFQGDVWVEVLNKKIKFLVFFLLACGGFSSGALAQQLIVHPGAEQTPMQRENVRALFTMRLRRWPDGTPVRVFVLPDQNPTHRQFAKKVLGAFPYQLRRAWDRAVFSGTGQAPVEVPDEAEMLERLPTKVMLRAEYHRVEGTSWLSVRENDLAQTEKDWDMFSLLASFRF
jgi:hypothetical protein